MSRYDALDDWDLTAELADLREEAAEAKRILREVAETLRRQQEGRELCPPDWRFLLTETERFLEANP